MRRPNTRTSLRTSAAELALGLLLGACSGEAATDTPTTPAATEEAPDAAPTATAEDIAALEAVEISGEGGETTVTLPTTPFSVSAATARLVSEGDGEEIAEGDLIELHSTWFDGKDGSTAQSTWADKPEQMVVSEASLAPVLADILIGGKVGVKFAFAVPSGEDTASVAVGEVVAKRPGRAVGTPVEPAAGLPTIELLDNGAPTMAEPVNADPTGELIVQPLIEGAGPEVAAGQTVTVHYTGWLWGGKQFDSSWDRGMTFAVDNIGQGSVIAGWNEGLVGQKVGSQVMLVVPPEKGYGDEEQQGIPPGSTLVFVVDILGAA